MRELKEYLNEVNEALSTFVGPEKLSAVPEDVYFDKLVGLTQTLMNIDAKFEKKEEPASEKQLNFLRSLIKTDDLMVYAIKYIKEKFDKDAIPKLTVEEASKLIDQFQRV